MVTYNRWFRGDHTNWNSWGHYDCDQMGQNAHADFDIVYDIL